MPMNSAEHKPNNNRIKVNVGGKVFETTNSTLQSTITTSTTASEAEAVFIDGNPEMFSSLLSLLRTHNLPSTPAHLLLKESELYGCFNLSPFLSPPPLSPFDASFVTCLTPPSSPIVSAFSTCCSSSSPILLAHSGQISCYHPTTLSFESALRTHVDDISSVASISPEVFVIGSDSSSGLHVYNRTRNVGSVFWVDDSDTRLNKSRVTAVADSEAAGLFAAFECKHGENAVLLVDKDTLKVVAEIGRQSGNSAKSSGITKMRWVPTLGLLVGSSVKCGAFGYSGYVRVWDPRSGEMVWETNEPGGVVRSSRLGDTMADVDVDPEGLFLAKVGYRSGDLGVADLRKLGPDPWVYLEDPNPSFSGNWKAKAGCSVVVHCYKGNVFVGRDGELEAWSSMGDVVIGEEDRDWGVYRRNFVDKVEDSEHGIITKIEGGGNRLFLCRENVEGVQVWETSHSSGVKTLI